MALARMTATADGSVTLTLERPDGTVATVTPKTVPAFGPPAEPAFAPSGGRGRLSPPSLTENPTPADRSC
jgi:hypothetical protein